MYHVEVVWGWGRGCCRFVSRTFDVMMFLLPTHAFVVHCPPDRSWLPMCEPRVKLSSRTCPLQFFADFRSTTETPLVGCRSNRALSPVTCRMLRRRVPPELCVSCAVVEVWRRLDLSPRGPRVPAHLESLPFTRASDSCVVLWEDARTAWEPKILPSCAHAVPHPVIAARGHGREKVVLSVALSGRHRCDPAAGTKGWGPGSHLFAQRQHVVVGTPGGGVEVTAPVTGVPVAQRPPPQSPLRAVSVCS